MNIRPIRKEDDPILCRIIRDTLSKADLDIPGTAYYDPQLEHLSDHYDRGDRLKAYYVLTDEADQVCGGGGFDCFSPFPCCAQLQKLYITPAFRGKGWGRELLQFVEMQAASSGFDTMYLETHHVLSTAIRLYESNGWYRIKKPAFVAHSAMDCFYMKKFK